MTFHVRKKKLLLYLKPFQFLSLLPSSVRTKSVDSGTIMYLTCQTSNCHPPAIVTWYNDNIEISDHTIVTVDTNQLFLSRMKSKLQYTVMPQDNGKNIYCIASNIQGERVVSEKITVDVRCKYVNRIHDCTHTLMFM